MNNFKLWSILSGLEVVLMMMVDSRLTSIFVGSIILWSLIFFAKECLSETYKKLFYWIMIVSTTVYLFYSGVNIWLTILYIIFGALLGISTSKTEKDSDSTNEFVMAITILFVWLTRDVPFMYKIIAPIILFVFYSAIESGKKTKEKDAARQHVNIDGNDYIIPQCNKCSSYNTVLVSLDELSTSYGRTEGHVEEQFLKKVYVATRMRFTEYELTYKCKYCGEIDTKRLQTRTKEYL